MTQAARLNRIEKAEVLMPLRLKPVRRQVVVITGASSGIGLATARALSVRGAKLVLVARNEEAIEKLAGECRRRGRVAIAVAADVGRFEDLERVSKHADETFGGFDTWINNAGVAIYGTCDDIPLEDHRRLFETNYWGVVYGSLIAARHLRDKGGKIINIGSVLGDRALILQGPYSASKHAVKGFTDALRMELQAERAPVSVTLIKPSAADTPYVEHARNYSGSTGTKNPPPSYDPAVVARAIVYACEHDRRDVVVGFGGWAVAALGTIAPSMTDCVMERTAFSAQESPSPSPGDRRDNLYAHRQDGAEGSASPGASRQISLFLEAQLNPAFGALRRLERGVGMAASLVFMAAANGLSRPSRSLGRKGEYEETKMTKELKKGDQVEWDTSQGKTHGTVEKKQTSETHIKSHKVVASKGNPQFIVKSGKSGKKAAHKPEELRKKS
jgi:short-subunit dehydrogenase